MKPYIKRTLPVLLALIMLLSILPIGVQAGGDEEIREARVFVHYPMGGQGPDMEGIKVGEAHYKIDFVHYFDCYDGMPVGKFLEDVVFVAGRLYACQVCLIPDEGYMFTDDTEVRINGRYPEYTTITNSEAYYTVFFYAANGTRTVTFDNNGHGKAHDPIAVPKGGTIADAVPDPDTEITPKNDGYQKFVMWAETPFASPMSYNAVGYTDPIETDTTLYAVFEHEPDDINLFITMQKDLSTDAVPPTITTDIENPDFEIIPECWWYSKDDIGIADLIYCFPFEQGHRFYSTCFLRFYGGMAEKNPRIDVYGAYVCNVRRFNEDTMEVSFYVDIPKNNPIHDIRATIKFPQANRSAADTDVELTVTTPGLNGVADGGWYSKASDIFNAAPYTGNFVAGQTYYTYIRLWSENFTLTPASVSGIRFNGCHYWEENHVSVARIDDYSSDGYPNMLGLVLAVEVLPAYDVQIKAVTHGRVRLDLNGWSWVDKFADYVSEGPITMEARPEPGYLFKCWIDLVIGQTISKEPTQALYIGRDQELDAVFVKATPFEDVNDNPNSFYFEAVGWAIDHDPVITNGTDDTHFSPNKDCTRADVVTFLWRTMGCPEPTTTKNPFTDVKSTAYYYKAVLWAVEKGITSGATPTTFNPKGVCTREQVVTFLWRAKGSPEPGSVTNPFTDVSSKSYAYKAILWAVSEGITSGTSSNKFSPKKACNRAQVVTFLYRAFGPKG